MRAPLALVALLALAGCIAPESVDSATSPAPDLAPAPPAPVRLVDIDARSGVLQGSEWDVACVFGGGIELERVEGAFIARGVRELIVTVAVPPTSTGVQVGYAVDEGDVSWLPVARPGGVTTLAIEVPEGADEEDAVRWSFHQQHNVFLAPQPCYTGGSLGGWAVTVETAAPDA